MTKPIAFTTVLHQPHVDGSIRPTDRLPHPCFAWCHSRPLGLL